MYVAPVKLLDTTRSHVSLTFANYTLRKFSSDVDRSKRNSESGLAPSRTIHFETTRGIRELTLKRRPSLLSMSAFVFLSLGPFPNVQYTPAYMLPYNLQDYLLTCSCVWSNHRNKFQNWQFCRIKWFPAGVQIVKFLRSNDLIRINKDLVTFIFRGLQKYRYK